MTLAALRRRWWLLVLCAAAVGAIAYGVGELRSRIWTAESVVAVSPGEISQGPGAVDQAFRLARDYATAVPRDAALLDTAAARLGRDVGGSVEVVRSPRSAILQLRYSAPNPASAVRGARVLSDLVAGPSPASATVVPGSVSTVRLPRSAQPSEQGFTAEALLIVRSGGGPTGPGYADQATELAPSFASSIPEDARVLGYVSRRLGVDVDEVEDNLSIRNDKDTTVLRLRYQTDDEQQAETAVRALANAVTGQAPASTSVPPRTLSLVRVGDAEAPSSDPAVTVPVGALLGLCLGLVLMLALERANSRVDTPTQLSDELRCPAFEMSDAVTPQSAGALLDRWRAMARSERPSVAVIPASRALEAPSARIADRLVTEGSESINGSLRVIVGRCPVDDPSGAMLAAESDVTVLVARQGQRLSEINATREVLDNFEAPISWALLVDRKAFKRLTRQPLPAERPTERPTRVPTA